MEPINIFWHGYPTEKNPLDMWIYQEIIYEVKPDIIIECGTSSGGSALFMASQCDILKNGLVVSIDIEADENRPAHERIRYLHGSSLSDEIVRKVKSHIENDDKVMAILDTEHDMGHVFNEMEIYGKMVTMGSYMIVEDTHFNGHPVYPEHGPGPMEAVKLFMKENDSFEIDHSREKFIMTFNVNGYLKKIK